MKNSQILSSKSPLRNPLIIALDVDSDSEAIRLSEELAPWAGAFKLGPRLCYRYGQSLVRRISALAPVFIDNKYFDIPSTMEAAIIAGFESGASLITIHALAGAEALSLIAQREAEFQKERPFLILNVTILTSWNENSLPSAFAPGSIQDHVLGLVKMVKGSGMSGVVCSAFELPHLPREGLFIVTPGIRFASDDANDQKRAMSPQGALAAGAQGLVVGRPIICAENPAKKAQQFLSSLNIG